MTQEMANAFEREIALHPQDWHMLQRLWQEDLEPRAGRPVTLPPAVAADRAAEYAAAGTEDPSAPAESPPAAPAA